MLPERVGPHWDPLHTSLYLGKSARPLNHDHICVFFYLFLWQGKRWILATDEWLRVTGCPDVYAIGDCATVDQRKIMVCKP